MYFNIICIIFYCPSLDEDWDISVCFVHYGILRVVPAMLSKDWLHMK